MSYRETHTPKTGIGNLSHEYPVTRQYPVPRLVTLPWNGSSGRRVGRVLVKPLAEDLARDAQSTVCDDRRSADMGKKGKKAQAGKPKKLTPKDVGKRLDVVVKKLKEELEGADLFAPLPPTEDCAICLLPMPRTSKIFAQYYMSCCGNEICWACYKENEESINRQNEEKNDGKKVALTCPFCREPEPTSDEGYLRQIQARCRKNDHNAFRLMGQVYRKGEHGVVKDDLKSLDCYIRAVELGSPGACACIGTRYDEGDGIAVDKERAALFQRTGALRGDIYARHLIGSYEYYDLGNHEIGIRHWMILAEAGHQDSLNKLWDIYADLKLVGREFITEKYLSFASRACHEARMEVWSEEREKHRSEECSSTLPPCSYDTYDYRY